MRPAASQPLVSRSWMLALLTGLVFVALGCGLRMEVEGADPDTHSWVDLALLLCGYLLVFCLKPIQKVILRKLRQRAAHPPSPIRIPARRPGQPAQSSGSGSFQQPKVPS